MESVFVLLQHCCINFVGLFCRFSGLKHRPFASYRIDSRSPDLFKWKFNKQCLSGTVPALKMEPVDSPSPPPDWLTLPDNVTVAIFDFFNPGKLLSLRRVCTQWQRLAEASAETRDKLVLMQCGCDNKGNCDCSMSLICNTIPDKFFIQHGLNADSTKFTKKDFFFEEDSQIALHAKVNGIHCRSFDWKNAQLLGRLFPQISHFTVSHASISAGHLDQIRYLLTEWSLTLAAFKFHSNYTLENPDGPVTDAINQTSAYINSHLTLLFTQLKTLPELKQLTLHYRKGMINSTVADFAFLPRLEELHLDRRNLEANLQAACQRYLAPHSVPGGPQPVLRRFAHHMNQYDATASEFTRFLRYSPEALPLAIASTWSQHCFFLLPSDLSTFLLRFPSVSYLSIPIPPGITLGPLSRLLSSQNVAVLCLDIDDTNAVGEGAVDELVPVPSVRGLTIALDFPDHGRIYPFLAQIPTVFPRLSSLYLFDFRSECSNAPPFSTAADEPPEFVRYAGELLAAYPNATQPAKYQQMQSYLTIARHINSTFPNISRTFAFKDQPGSLTLQPTNQH